MTSFTPRTRKLGTLAAAGSLCLCACSQAVGTAAGTRTIEVADPQYQMTAYTFEIPSNWKFAGTMVRNDSACHSSADQLKFTLQSPDGPTIVASLPGVTWHWTTDPLLFAALVNQHCLPTNIATAAGFLGNIALPIMRPGAKIIAVLPLAPDNQASVAEQMKQVHAGDEKFTRARIKPPKRYIDGARLRIEYALNGKPVEEQLQSIIDCTETEGIPMPRQPNVYMTRQCSARNINIVRAPKGHLDELLSGPILANFNKSIRLNDAWLGRMEHDQQALVQQAIARSNQQFQEMMGANKERFDGMVQQGRNFQNQQQKSFESHMALAQGASDARANAAIQQEHLSLNLAQFTDPNTGQKILASNQFAHQWESSDSSMILQKDDPFDPNGTVEPVMTNPAGITWNEIYPDR
jgi:hypothetical protein